MDKHLHIVCFDVPYPADYGGAVELFHTLKHLSSIQVKIHLHCFDYGRGHHKELDQYCVEVNYYTRKNFFSSFLSGLPYIVSSRNNPHLLKNLLKDNHPILLEGIHCTYFLYKEKLVNRKVMIRLHNVEYKYYSNLADSESSFLKKIYFQWESRLLKRYEKLLSKKALFFAMTKNDQKTYTSMGATKIKYLPPFLPCDKVKAVPGKGTFCLYHGDLSIGENKKAVLYLLKIFKAIQIPFVIAGKSPCNELKTLAEENEHVCVISDPGEEELNDLLLKAQIHVLPSFNTTGRKIKLLNALFNGRHCIVNESTVSDSGLESLCHICDTDEMFQQKIIELFSKEFTETDIMERRNILENNYNSRSNAIELTQAIW